VDGGTPLEVIRVFVGGASEGLLQVGDRIVSINHQSMENISHFEAQHLFKSSGPSVRLEVGRLVQSACPVPPAPSVSPMRRRHQECNMNINSFYVNVSCVYITSSLAFIPVFNSVISSSTSSQRSNIL